MLKSIKNKKGQVRLEFLGQGKFTTKSGKCSDPLRQSLNLDIGFWSEFGQIGKPTFQGKFPVYFALVSCTGLKTNF